MKKTILLAYFIFLYFIITSTAYASDANDWQYWFNGGMEVKLPGNWKAKIEEEIRSEQTMIDPYHHYTEAALNYKVNTWFSIELSYRHIYEKKGGEWNLESRPHANGVFRWHLHKMAFENRSRLELRIREDKDNVWRYRNKTTLSHRVGLGHRDFNPYISEEIYYDFDESEINRNRVYVGVKHNLTRSVGLDVYYLWQATKSSDDWVDFNILGVKLKVAI